MYFAVGARILGALTKSSNADKLPAGLCVMVVPGKHVRITYQLRALNLSVLPALGYSA